VGGNILFIGWPDGNLRALRAYFRCLSSNSGSAGVRFASLTSGAIDVVLRAPVIALACLLTSF
jgi:hypothetical protein